MSSQNNAQSPGDDHLASKVTNKQLVPKNKLSKSRSSNNTKSSNKNKISVNNTTNNNNNNKPLKVVYISNPMKFQVSADEFQALVQGLTGRDAAEWTDNNSNNYLNRDGAPTADGGIDDDDDEEEEEEEVRQGPLMEVNMDSRYDVPSEMSSLDYFGPFDGGVHVVEDIRQINDYGGFPSFYD